MDFYNTVMGKRFYESTMPTIARNLEQLSTILNEFNTGNNFIELTEYGSKAPVTIAINHIAGIHRNTDRLVPTHDGHKGYVGTTIALVSGGCYIVSEDYETVKTRISGEEN